MDFLISKAILMTFGRSKLKMVINLRLERSLFAYITRTKVADFILIWRDSPIGAFSNWKYLVLWKEQNQRHYGRLINMKMIYVSLEKKRLKYGTDMSITFFYSA